MYSAIKGSSFTVSNTVTHKKWLLALTGFVICLMYLNIIALNRLFDRISQLTLREQPVEHNTYTVYHPNSSISMTAAFKGFLVSSSKCRIPDLDPFSPGIRVTVKNIKRPVCMEKKPLTTVEVVDENTGRAILIFHSHLASEYTSRNLRCCYSEIQRGGSGYKADRSYVLSKCMEFNTTIILPSGIGSILTSCKDTKNRTVYSNIHVLVPRNETIKKQLDDWRGHKSNVRKPPSVILFGIDNMSRLNLIRAMPNTYQYLIDTGWFEMAGYNKVGWNTLPNLMALLTGNDKSTSKKHCSGDVVGGLDKCNFVWKDYQQAGYVTAYAEDLVSLSTFNYLKVGFESPPTMCYLRPTMIAAEKLLKVSHLRGMKFCLGYKNGAEYVYDYIFEMRRTYKDYPQFGLFWSNSFSHDSFEVPAVMDTQIKSYLRALTISGTLNETIVVFLSDHGMRVGTLRNSPTGYLEERLPMLYFWLPPMLRQQHPEFVKALETNRNRLTSPFDLHATLKHILELSGRVNVSRSATGCPTCQSLFEPVPLNRSCEDAGIVDHWCTCREFHSIDKNSAIVTQLTQRTIDYMNDLVQHVDNGSVAHLCEKLSLKEILDARKIDLPLKKENLKEYRLTFDTKPGTGRFEATVLINTLTDEFTVSGSVSRMSLYVGDAYCVDVFAAKKYCFCKNQMILP